MFVFFCNFYYKGIFSLQRDDASNNGGTLLKTNIQVGDDTMSYFSVSVWQKYMGSMVVAGDIILLQSEHS